MSIGVGIIGAGTVGSGVLEILTTRMGSLSKAAGTDIKVACVAARFEHELAPWKALGIPVLAKIAGHAFFDGPEIAAARNVPAGVQRRG